MKTSLIFFSLLLCSAYAQAAPFSIFNGNCDLIKINNDGTTSQTPQSFDLSGNSAGQTLEFTVEGVKYDVGVYMETELSPSEVVFSLSSPDNRNLISTTAVTRDPVPGPEITFSASFSAAEYLTCSGQVQ